MKVPRVYKGITDPDMLFDMICTRNWFCGNLDANIPVEESRAAYQELKRLIIHSNR